MLSFLVRCLVVMFFLDNFMILEIIRIFFLVILVFLYGSSKLLLFWLV